MWRVKSWRWFTIRVQGLLSADTPIARVFAADPAAPEQPEVNDAR